MGKRFEPRFEYCIEDNEKHNTFYCDRITVCKILNEQDDKIKELEEENQQLKQSQNSKAIEVLRKILENYNMYQHSAKHTVVEAGIDNEIGFIDYIKNQIKELGGRENE